MKSAPAISTDFAVNGDRPPQRSPFDPANFPMFLTKGLPIRVSFEVSFRSPQVLSHPEWRTGKRAPAIGNLSTSVSNLPIDVHWQ
jgi:hypothetical protein